MKYILFFNMLITFSHSQTLQNIMANILPLHPKIKEAKNEYLISKQELELAKKEHNPTINFTYDDGKEYTATFTNLKKKKILNEYKLRLTAELNIFSGFRISNKIKEKEKYKLVSKHKFKKTLIEISFKFLQNYLNLKQKLKLFNIATENLHIYQETYMKILSRIEIGLGYESEKYQTLSRVELSKSNKNLAEQNYKIALLNYQTIIRDYTFQDNESNKIELENIDLINFDEENIITNYAKGNIDIDISKLMAGISFDKYKQGMSKFYPTLDIKASRIINANTNGLENRETSSKIYFSMKYNIYNGGRDLSSRASQIYKVNKYRNQFENSNINQIEKLKLNLIRYKMIKQQLFIRRDQIINLSKTQNLYQKEFENNKRTVLELLNIRQELNSARVQKNNLYYDALELLFKIKISEGTYLDFFNLKKIVKLK